MFADCPFLRLAGSQVSQKGGWALTGGCARRRYTRLGMRDARMLERYVDRLRFLWGTLGALCGLLLPLRDSDDESAA